MTNLTKEQKADLVVKKCYRMLQWAQKVNPNKDNRTMKDSQKIAVSKKLGRLLKKAERYQEALKRNASLKSKSPKEEPIDRSTLARQEDSLKGEEQHRINKTFMKNITKVLALALPILFCLTVFSHYLFVDGKRYSIDYTYDRHKSHLDNLTKDKKDEIIASMPNEIRPFMVLGTKTNYPLGL